MNKITVKGHTFNEFLIRDSFDRRALGFKNDIINNLKKIGIIRDDVDIDLEPVARKRAPASATWFLEGHYMYYSYSAALKYVDNLYVISKLIELEVKAILEGSETIQEFINKFSEESDVVEERKKARELLGVEADSLDFEEINKKYKALAKKHHPDMGGDINEFKKLNKAWLLLKRELV